MPETILIVDDEKSLRDVMALFLSAEGFSVLEADSGEAGLELFWQHQPDLVVLDIMLPGLSGYEVCEAIRKKSDVPILFLTALEDDEHHLLGYRMGADDYIAKPSFKASILAMKAKRMLARRVNTGRETIVLGDILLDIGAHTCTVAGRAVVLTQTEFSLLRMFMENPGRVLTREHLLRTIWGYNYNGDERAVDTMVKKLRKKLGPSAGIIKTMIAVGYKLEEAP